MANGFCTAVVIIPHVCQKFDFAWLMVYQLPRDCFGEAIKTWRPGNITIFDWDECHHIVLLYLIISLISVLIFL